MKKKLLFNKIAYLLLLNFFALSLNAQEGPGGVGDASNNPFWFAADQLSGLSNNDPVTTWNNIGSQNISATQATNNRKPTFENNQINSLPALSFDGGDFLTIPSNNSINQNGPFSKRTISMTFQTGANVTSRQVLYEEGGAIRGLNIFIENGNIYVGGYNLQASDGADSPWGYSFINTAINSNTTNVVNFVFDGNASKTGTITAYLNGNSIGNIANVGRLFNHNEANIGAQDNDSYYPSGSDSSNNAYHFNGLIPEVIIYNKALNNSERIVLENYLASKYDISLLSNDLNAYDTNANGDFDFHSVGIARINSADLYLTSNIGTGVISVANNNLPDNASLILSGNNYDEVSLENTFFGCSSNSLNLYRTVNTWRVSKTGSFTNSAIEIDLSAFGLSGSVVNDVQLEVSTTSNFSGSNTIFNATSNIGSIVSFENINLNDGEYFKFLLPNSESTSTLPGGVSTIRNTQFWMRAESLSLVNGNSVQNWQNEGSNTENAEQSTTSSQPLYLENQFNSYPAIDFTSTDKHLSIPNNPEINIAGPYSKRSFTVAFETSTDISTKQVIYEEGGNARNLHILIEGNNLIVGGFNNSNSDGPGDNWVNKQINTVIAPNTKYVLSFIFDGSSDNTNNPNGSFRMHLNNALIGNVSGVGLLYAHSGDINIGGHQDNVLMNGNVGTGNYYKGKIAEFMIHASVLNTTEISAMHNYLGSKYDINLGLNNVNVYNQNAEGDFDHDLVAIYNVNTNFQDNSKFGTGLIRIKDPTNLDNGEYRYIVSNSKNYSLLNGDDLNCTSNSIDDQKLETIWRVGGAGNVGSLTLEFDNKKLNIPASSYSNIELLVSNNASFTSPVVYTSSINCEYVSFNSVNLNDGDYFTFRLKGVEPIQWTGSQFLYGSGINNTPSLDDYGRKLVIKAGSNATLNNSANVGCIVVDTNAKLIINGSAQITITGNINANGEIDASSGIIQMNGDTNQTINWSDKLLIGHLELDTAFEVELTTTSTPLRITELLSIPSGTLRTNGNLTLTCQFTDLTKRVAQIDDLTNGTITGNITTEQCIPARRAFRFLSSPVTTSNSIHDNWQEGATAWNDDPNPGYGTHITGALIDQTNGFDLTPSGNPGLFVYNNASQSWNPIANTDVNTLTAGTPYRLMVRGDRSTDITSNTAVASQATLRATGTITSGNLDLAAGFNTSSGSFNFFGNPYPAAIDVSQVMNSATGVQKDYYIWDPNLGTRGSFVTIDLEAPNIGTNAAGSAANEFLQPGQAAFVRVVSPGTPQMLLNETNKNVSVSQTATFSNNPISMVDLTLYKSSDLSEGETPKDGL
ncbi:MAG: LamG-like jellyroll fold domain-containing protein, partial [Ruoffia tabacinasalis]